MKCLVCLFLVFSLSTAQDCPLPTKADVEKALNTLLLSSNCGHTSITRSVQYVCQAQGTMINTYRSVSLIATYTPNPGQPEDTSIFEMQCNRGSWIGDTIGRLSAPPNSVIGAPTKTNCFQCRNGFGDTRCRG